MSTSGVCGINHALWVVATIYLTINTINFFSHVIIRTINMQLSNKVKKTIPYLIGIITLLYIIKPNICFKQNNQLRNYGFGYDKDNYKKTLFTMQNLIIFITILLYIIL